MDNEENRTQCPVCGREVGVNWNFCDKCGLKLKANPVMQELDISNLVGAGGINNPGA